jgi:hypothetical protein
MRVFWDIAPCSLLAVYRRFVRAVLAAISTYETSVNFYETTRCSIPEDCHLLMKASSPTVRIMCFSLAAFTLVYRSNHTHRLFRFSWSEWPLNWRSLVFPIVFFALQSLCPSPCTSIYVTTCSLCWGTFSSKSRRLWEKWGYKVP